MVESTFIIPPDSSGKNIHTTSQTISGTLVQNQQIGIAKNPTYSILAEDVIIKSGGTLLSMWHVSGAPVVSVQGMKIINTSMSLQSGQNLHFNIIYPSAAPTGGTNLSAVPYDRLSPGSGLCMTIMTAPTNVFSGQNLRTIVTTNGSLGTTGVTGSQASGMNVWGVQNAILQDTNTLFNAPDINEVVLRSGLGFAIQQKVSGAAYVQCTSGTFTINVLYSVEF